MTETADPVRRRSVAAQGAVYGCVSSAIAIAVETTETRKAMAITVVLTVLVYAATHGYAHILGAGAIRGSMARRQKVMAFVDEWPLLCGGLGAGRNPAGRLHRRMRRRVVRHHHRRDGNPVTALKAQNCATESEAGMGFESDVNVREVDDDTWELLEPLIYVGNMETFVVPKGFQTDFASVPRAFVWLLPRYGRYTKASIVHDFLCDESKAGRFNRDDADGIFRRAMRELGVSFLRRWIMWGAVAAATQWVRIRSSKGVSAPRLGQIALIAVPSTIFFAVPFLTITVWLLLFWVAEVITFLVLKPFSEQPVNPPKLSWRLS